MNPSSSSNADAPRAPTFRVATRGLDAALAHAGVEQSPRDLGDLAAGPLADLFTRFLALDSAAVEEADAHFVVTGRRGRFIVRAQGASLLLQPVGDPTAAFVTLPPEAAPAWLEQSEHNSAGSAVGDGFAPASASTARPRRTGPAAVFAAVSLLLLALSAWLTFTPAEVDPAADYGPVTDAATLASLRQQAPGLYATAEGDRTLEVRPDGTLVYRERGAGPSAEDDRSGPYAFAFHRETKTPVLRVEGLGTVQLRDAQHLIFAHETYTRRAAK